MNPSPIKAQNCVFEKITTHENMTDLEIISLGWLSTAGEESVKMSGIDRIKHALSVMSSA